MPYRTLSSRDHLKLIKRYFGIGTWSYDIRADRFEWSDGLRRLLRLETAAENTLGEFLDMAHPDDRQSLADKIRTGLSLETAPLRMKAADGAQLWLLFQMDVRSEDEGPFIVFGAAQDVTASKNAHAVYMLKHRLSMSLVNMLDAIVWHVSPSGFLDFEVGWCSFTGSKPNQSHGDGWLNFIHPEDRERSKAAWDNAIRTKSAFQTSHRVRRSDGSYHAFQATSAPVLDDKGVIMEIIGFARRVFGEDRQLSASNKEGQPPWTADDYRCARAMLGWSLERLATESGVSPSTIKRIESEGHQKVVMRRANHDRLHAVFDAAGIRLTWDSDGVGVIRQRLRTAPLLVTL